MNRKLHIIIHSMGMPFDGDTLKSKSLGGSESAAYYKAHELARRGHQVDLWTNSPTTKEIDGVRYGCIGQVDAKTPMGHIFEHFVGISPADVLIVQRHAMAFHRRWPAPICIHELHDLALHRTTHAVWHGSWQVSAFTAVSDWHRQQILDVYGLKPDAVAVVRNGVDGSLYETPRMSLAELPGAARSKFKLLYQSRPERGLEHLLRPGGIMDRLQDTDCHLLICGYDNTQPQMVPFYGQLDAWARDLPNVSQLGALTKAKLAALQKACDLHVYPTEFDEVSCISAMEAQHAALPAIASECGALPETVDGAGCLMVPLVDGKANEDAFVDHIRRMSDSGSRSGDLVRLAGLQRQAAKHHTWQRSVDSLEELIDRQYAGRTEYSLLRYGFEHSDIAIARSAYELVAGMIAPVENELALYGFATSEAGYAKHYAKHQGIYYDGHENQVIGEDVSGTQRFQAVMTLISKKQDDLIAKGHGETGNPPPMRILDYGCAHGHYLVPFAKMLPTSKLFGVDISLRAIGACMKWLKRDGIENVTLAQGGLDKVAHFASHNALRQAVGAETFPEDIPDPRFDIIIAGEVLEHVPDPIAVLEDLRLALKDDGRIIATTPVGRWEWMGTTAFREAREHLWHFTKDDLDCMLAAFKHEIFFAPGGADQSGGIVGSYCWYFENDMSARVGDLKLPPVDVRRDRIMPRQTVSACMIVKDGERTLRKCIDAIVDWVDEIVIGIDPDTSDRTQQILTELIGDYPLRPFVIVDGVVALVDGFAAARNKTLDAASGEWILWLDADEEVQRPWNLYKYLKPSAVDGFGLPQVHYSCDPPKVLTVDHPTRLFRRSSGARFFGYVHEHPEVVMGKAVPYTILRDDIQFLHAGYVDEDVRRKRHTRNFPLLQRDFAENPERIINKFLALRDMVQSVIFEAEKIGGLTQPLIDRLRQAIALYESQIDTQEHVRMLVDGLEYYSIALSMIEEGFDSKVLIQVQRPDVQALNVSTEIAGRFRNQDVYIKLVSRIQKEATKFYESKYL